MTSAKAANDRPKMDAARRGGPALEAMFRFIVWLIPTLDKFPRSQRFLLGDRIQATALDVVKRLIDATYSKTRERALGEATLGLEQGRRLVLHPDKTTIHVTAQPAAFLGIVVMLAGRRRLPEENVRRFRNRLRGLRDRWRAGSIEREEVERRVSAWIGHAAHADTWRLRRAIFRGGWFDPTNPPP